MRLAAQIKLGFYPCPLGVVDLIAERHVTTTNPDSFAILDPCCGEGEAVKRLADKLGVTNERIFAVELDRNRAAKAVETISGAHIMNTSFQSVYMTPGSIGLAWVNPPFDQELGGGRREEASFVSGAWSTLASGGVLVLISTKSFFASRDRCVQQLASHFDGKLYKFPEELRRFDEWVYIGAKRKDPKEYASAYDLYKYNHDAPDLGDPAVIPLSIPRSSPCRAFKKFTYEETELIEATARSPIHRVAFRGSEFKAERPPLPLNRGHRALALASGILDGLVETDDPDDDHVTRGITRKIKRSRVEYSFDPDTDVHTQKIVTTEHPVTTARILFLSDGSIKTLGVERDGESDDETELDE